MTTFLHVLADLLIFVMIVIKINGMYVIFVN